MEYIKEIRVLCRSKKFYDLEKAFSHNQKKSSTDHII